MKLFAQIVSLLLLGGQMLQAAHDRSFLSLNPFSARPDGTQNCVALVKVFGDTGAPTAGQLVTLVSSRGTADVVGPANPRATDANGEVTFTIRSSVRGVSTLTAVCNGQTISKGIIKDGAVGIWSFEGDARDLSGKNNNGTLQSAPVFAAGKHGQAIALDGLSQYVTVPHHSSLNNRQAWTIDTWLYLDALQSKRSVILQKSGSSGGDFYLSLSNKTVRTRCATRSGADDLNKYAVETANTVLSAGKWVHLVGVWAGSRSDPVWDDGSLRIFVDGVEKKGWDIARYLCRNQSEPLNIGRNPAGGDYYQGKLDELKLYDRPLYPPEIQRSRDFSTTAHFTLDPPGGLVARTTQPECVILSWARTADANVTSYKIYRSTSGAAAAIPGNLVDEVPCSVTNCYDWKVDYGVPYRYAIAACAISNESLPSSEVTATPARALTAPGWYGGDTHVHCTNSWDVWYHTPAEFAAQARSRGFDFLFITDHNSIVSRHEIQANSTPSFIGLAGEEVSLSANGDNDHFNAFFINRYVPADGNEIDLHEQVRVQGGLAHPNHCGYYTETTNIDGLEVIHGASVKSETVRAWDWYLQRGYKLMGRGSTDNHGDAGKITTLLWLERLSYKELYNAFKLGRACAVTGPGIECMLKVNGAMIGDTLTIPPNRTLTIDVTAKSDTNITKVELIRFGTVMTSSAPNSMNATLHYADVSGPTNTYYRLQVQDAAGKWALGGVVYVKYQPTVGIQSSTGVGGSLTPSGLVTVIQGGSTNFVIAAQPDYRIAQVRTNGASIGIPFGNQSTHLTYTWANITANGSIAAQFTPRLTSNGVPFTWLSTHGISSRENSIGQEDADQDGWNNLQEWVSDTNPTSASSGMPPLNIRPTLGAPELSVSVTSTERVYCFWSSTNLLSASTWLSNYSSLGSGSGLVYRLPLTTVPHFYRLSVSLPE